MGGVNRAKEVLGFEPVSLQVHRNGLHLGPEPNLGHHEHAVAVY